MMSKDTVTRGKGPEVVADPVQKRRHAEAEASARWQRLGGELRDAFAAASSAHAKAAREVKLAKKREGELAGELRKLPELGHARVDALRTEARDLFNRRAVAGSWFASLVDQADGSAPLPPAELAVLHLLATDESFGEGLHGAIRHQLDTRSAAGFTRRERKEIEAERVSAQKRITKLEREERKAKGELDKASERLRRYELGQD